MAFAAVATFITAGNKTAASTRTLATSATVEVGNLAVLAISCDNLTTTDGNSNDVTSVTDVRSNTWVKALEYTNGEGAAGSGITSALFYCVPTTQLTSGDNITINFSASLTAVQVKGSEFTKGAGTTIAIDGAGQEAVDAGDPGSITLTGANSGEHLWVRVISGETATTTFSSSSGYSKVNAAATSGGAADTNVMCGWEYKISTGTGSGASNPTATTADWASVMVGLIEVNNNNSGITLASISLDKLAVSATTTENHFSAITLAAISLDKLNLSAATTENHFTDLALKDLALTASAISATTTENHFSAITLKDIAISSIAIEATTTSAAANTSAIPVSQIVLDSHAVTSETTEKHYSAISLKDIAITTNAIEATTTGDSANTSDIPVAAALVQSLAVSAATTEKNFSDITTQAIALSSLAVSATTTDNNYSGLTLKDLSIASLAVLATTTERHQSALEVKGLSIVSYAIGADMSWNNIVKDTNNPLIVGSQDSIAATSQKAAVINDSSMIRSTSSKQFKAGQNG